MKGLRAARSPASVVALLLALSGGAAWLGVAQSSNRNEDLLAQVWAATSSFGIAQFAETTGQTVQSPSTGRHPVFSFTSSSIGSIDFGTGAIALRTRVLQTDQRPMEYLSFISRGKLYELVQGATSTGRWTEEPYQIDPIMSIPGLAVIRYERSNYDMLERLGADRIAGVRTTKFRLLPDLGATCVIPNGPNERFSSTVTIWVDARDRLRRVEVSQKLQATYGPGSRRPTVTRSDLNSIVTFSSFGRQMLFGPPSTVLRLATPHGPHLSASATKPACQMS